MKNFELEKWFDLYKSAMLELERAAMTGRLADARGEIASRVEALKQLPVLHPEEDAAIVDALNNLRVLEKEEARLAAGDKKRLLEEAARKLQGLAPIIPGYPDCAICRKPLDLKTAKADGNGNGVHEKCSVEKIVRVATTDLNSRPEYSVIACEEIVDAAVSLMRSDYASLQMLFPKRGTGGELRLLAFRGFNPEAAKFWEWVRADSKSTCGMALRDSKRVVAVDIAACDFMADSEDRQVYLQTGIHACQTTPVFTRTGNLVGMISTHWCTAHQPSEREFQAFDILANQAADVIEHIGAR